MEYYESVMKNEILRALQNKNDYDSWGEVFYGDDEKGVDYNICIDNSTDETEFCSAFYRFSKSESGNYWEHDGCQEWYSYEIDFSDKDWEIKLKDAAKKAFEELWMK